MKTDVQEWGCRAADEAEDTVHVDHTGRCMPYRFHTSCSTAATYQHEYAHTISYAFMTLMELLAYAQENTFATGLYCRRHIISSRIMILAQVLPSVSDARSAEL